MVRYFTSLVRFNPRYLIILGTILNGMNSFISWGLRPYLLGKVLVLSMVLNDHLQDICIYSSPFSAIYIVRLDWISAWGEEGS